jgi:hypothetical protein
MPVALHLLPGKTLGCSDSKHLDVVTQCYGDGQGVQQGRWARASDVEFSLLVLVDVSGCYRCDFGGTEVESFEISCIGQGEAVSFPLVFFFGSRCCGCYGREGVLGAGAAAMSEVLLLWRCGRTRRESENWAFANPEKSVRWEGVPRPRVGDGVYGSERSIVDGVAGCILVADAEGVYAVACFGIAVPLAAPQVESDVLTLGCAGSYRECL